jgi:hypothetical protein
MPVLPTGQVVGRLMPRHHLVPLLRALLNGRTNGGEFRFGCGEAFDKVQNLFEEDAAIEIAVEKELVVARIVFAGMRVNPRILAFP